MSARVRRWAATSALVVGIGLAAAPAAFQMFSRAPLGGTMIDDFRPYMRTAKIDSFRAHMDEIDAAATEATDLRTTMIADGALTAEDYDAKYGGVNTLTADWATIDADMGDLLDRMDTNMGNYAAVAALPPFPMFPWFFVLPGVMVAAVAASVLWSLRQGTPHRRRLWALAALGVALIAAPAVFQMFTRAPKGADMIDSFRPMMTRERVQDVQRYFITLGGAEGQLRVGLLPAYEAAGGDAADYPAIAAWSAEWPTIVGEFNPMIATMSDNVDNFQAVDALPPFGLFPWFFVLPGALVGGAAMLALRQTDPPTQPNEKETS
ncbi:MAG: hypothetical protein Q7V88_10580 [Actinomycetota bacterium]|nr:hypothetical protein [Actinomycetota bacterium]